jgi:hypothetical protein
MKLDRIFQKELRTANGDGSRAAKFAFLAPTKAACKELSTTNVKAVFADVLHKYGRASVGICIAATILDRQDRLSDRSVRWAREVMRLWTNRPADIGFVVISDGLHPTRIEEYAGSFVQLTTDEP